MKQRVLVTGGAGFIGSFLVDDLIKKGYSVRILDNIEEQVHQGRVPSYLNKNAEFIKGDIRDKETIKKSIADIDVIFHFAAMVGVGQSMYQIRKYMDVNVSGTANLLNAIVNTNNNIKKIIVASSMSTYGEGNYECINCGIIEPKLRSYEQMKRENFKVYCPKCGSIPKPIPTKEEKKQDINSIYALSKMGQELMVLNIGNTYGIPAVALRYFNVYGPRQSLSNPYTGVAAIFMSRIKNNNPPLIFEDGNQSRDFISVYDITVANILAMEKKSADYDVFNVGSGSQITIKQVAEILLKLYGKDLKPLITNKSRKGDVKHCFADISKIRNKLDFKPKISFKKGMEELTIWSKSAESVDKVEQATQELKDKGLLDS